MRADNDEGRLLTLRRCPSAMTPDEPLASRIPVIFKRKRKASSLNATVSELEEAVAARDGDRTERAFIAVIDAVQPEPETEHVLAGPRLAALITT
ncbi:hypothetical protein ACIQZO_04795 [Streptomyces sp. NPDC097617]|uniref:hypothetical protein n=1 Tax=Streptomyces sp. NPDC097617 TaxID=3366091 RepID=UPI0037F12BF2